MSLKKSSLKKSTLNDCVLINNYHPYDIKKSTFDDINDGLYGADWINDESTLLEKGYNVVIGKVVDSDAIVPIVAKELTNPSKDFIKLFKTAFNFKQHFMKTSNSSLEGCNALYNVGSLNLECPGIWCIGDTIKIRLTSKADKCSNGSGYSISGFETSLSKEDFWSKSNNYDSKEANEVISWLRDIISPVVEKYDSLGMDVDGIYWSYIGDPTIDWSCISKNAVTFYEGVEKDLEEHYKDVYNVHFIMHVDHSKCKRDIAVLRNMYAVYLEEGNTEGIKKLYKENGKAFDDTMANYLISTLRKTSKKENISELGISDTEVLKWFDEVGNN